VPDQQITCTTCGRRFTWSVGEQEFYRERGLQTPRRCPDCREARRQQTTTAPSSRHSSPQPPRSIAHQPRPRRVFGVTTLVAAAALSLGLFMLIPSAPLLAWLIAINLVTLLTYGYDKAIAGGAQMRVPEAVLLGLALIGGSAGAFVGMLLFRHKVSKPAFLVPFGLIVVLQVGLLISWLMLSQR
jgi:uncharacterized membrane protein YsdA (DUF1294 family)